MEADLVRGTPAELQNLMKLQQYHHQINCQDGRFREKFSLFGEACLEFISTFYAKSCEVKKHFSK